MADGELLFKYAKKLSGIEDHLWPESAPRGTNQVEHRSKGNINFTKKMARIYHARSGSLLLCARNSG
jgi:hypothetical protein